MSLLALALFDFYPDPIERFTLMEPRAVCLLLAEQPGQGGD